MRKWSRWELAGRILWVLAYPLFRFSPRPLWGWRRLLLRCFGAKIGADVNIHPTVAISIPWHLIVGDYAGIGDRVNLYALGDIRIGDAATISQGAHLCAGSHDYRDPRMSLTKPPITIGAGAWICADAFIGPGVVIGRNAIVGARAVVMKDVPEGLIVAGNPARRVGQR